MNTLFLNFNFKVIMEELLATLRSYSHFTIHRDEDTYFHGDEHSLEELISKFHAQIAQWNQFMSVEMSTCMEDEEQEMNVG